MVCNPTEGVGYKRAHGRLLEDPSVELTRPRSKPLPHVTARFRAWRSASRNDVADRRICVTGTRFRYEIGSSYSCFRLTCRQVRSDPCAFHAERTRT